MSSPADKENLTDGASANSTLILSLSFSTAIGIPSARLAKISSSPPESGGCRQRTNERIGGEMTLRKCKKDGRIACSLSQ